jgi:hypothetical protein
MMCLGKMGFCYIMYLGPYGDMIYDVPKSRFLCDT